MGFASKRGSPWAWACAYRDTIPIFVHHHHTEEHAERKEEESVDIVLDSIAYGDTKCKEEHLSDSEEGGTKYDIANRPSVIQGSEDKHQLRYNVDHCTDQRPKDVDDP